MIRTPVRAPRANAFAERWVRSVRTECLDWTLILGRRHLKRVLHAYVGHYNRGRPHRSLDLATPEVRESTRGSVRGRIGLVRRDALGGLVHEFELAA